MHEAKEVMFSNVSGAAISRSLLFAIDEESEQGCEPPGNAKSEDDIKQAPTEISLNFRMNFYGPEGNRPPPLPASMDEILQWSTKQYRAATARQRIIEQNDLEEDVFGLLHHRFITQLARGSDFSNSPTSSSLRPEPKSQTERILRLIKRENSPTLIPAERHATTKFQNDIWRYGSPGDQSVRKSTYAKIPSTITRQNIDEVGPIVSDKNPEFRELAQALSDYQSTSSASPTHSRPDEHRFKPSHMVQEKKNMIKRESEEGAKYLGDTSSRSYAAQIPDLEDAVNCAVWVTNLPRHVSVTDFLKVVRTGAVFAVHINQANAIHQYSAAKLVFMESSAAAAFHTLANSLEGLYVNDSKIRVTYNRNGYRDNEHPERTRVLRIRGPTHLMDMDVWKRYFDSCVDYQLEVVRQRPVKEYEMLDMEFRFARVDGQSQSVYQAIKKEPKFRGVYQVWYGPDPCNPLS